jgi:PAS domain S-box-containing protein
MNILDAAFESIPDMLSIHDNEFTIIQVNKAFADGLGLERGQIEGRRCYEVIHGIGKPWEQCAHVRAIEAKSTVVEETLYPRLNRWLRVSVSPIWKEGRVVGTVHIARDITEPWNREQGLRRGLDESEQLHRTVLASLDDQIAILDGRGAIIAVNEAWIEFGRLSGAVGTIGAGVDYLDACRRAIAHPDDWADQALKGIESVLAGSRTRFVLEYPSGRPMEKQRFKMTVVPLKRPEGGVVIGHRDITEQKRNEEALRKKERILAAAERMIHVGSFEWDFASDEIAVSEEVCRRCGLDPQDSPVSAAYMVSIFHPADRWRMLQRFEALREGKERYLEDEFKVIRPDGTVADVLIRGESVFDEYGKTVAAVGALLDITTHCMSGQRLVI